MMEIVKIVVFDYEEENEENEEDSESGSESEEEGGMLSSLDRNDGEIHFVQGKKKIGSSNVPKSSGKSDKQYPVSSKRRVSRHTRPTRRPTGPLDNSIPLTMRIDTNTNTDNLGLGLDTSSMGDNSIDCDAPIYYTDYTAVALTDTLRVICINKPEALVYFNVCMCVYMCVCVVCVYV